jgi:hypothetical protein
MRLPSKYAFAKVRTFSRGSVFSIGPIGGGGMPAGGGGGDAAEEEGDVGVGEEAEVGD